MTAPRSKSVPAIRSTDRESDVEEESSAFPPLLQEVESDQRIPTWIQELAKSRAGRSSRASSVVSTRTRFSTTTFDDTRSIEIQAGGQSYRIGRFGDRVTETTAPPPYPGPNFDELTVHHHETHDSGDQGDDHSDHTRRRRRNMGGGWGGGRKHVRRVRIAMPDHEGPPNPNDDDSMTADTPSRVLTDEELRQIIQDLPSRLKTVLGIHADHADPDNTSPLDAHGTSSSEDPESSRAFESSSSGVPHSTVRRDDKAPSNGYVRGILRNAPENAPYQSDASMLERGEVKWKRQDDEERHHTFDDSTNPIPPESLLHREISTAPTVADLNELSQVYNKVIRDLDREHRKQLHNRDKELDQLRTLLHEKDIVYRQQLKGKDFVIEDMKARMDRFEETMELRLERERYAVEDLWESRWREHQTQLMEKCGLIRPALGRYADSHTQTDD